MASYWKCPKCGGQNPPENKKCAGCGESQPRTTPEIPIPLDQYTPEQKLTAMVQYLRNINLHLEAQSRLLKSIEIAMGFFVVITILAVIVQGCSVLGLL
jgi:hypothetical protein